MSALAWILVVVAFAAGFAAGALIRRVPRASAPSLQPAPEPPPGTEGTDTSVLVCEIHTSDDETLIRGRRFLDDLQRVLAGIVRDEGGSIDRFAGRRTIALFTSPDHASAALEAARRMSSNVEALARRGLLDITLGIGVHSGPVDSGNAEVGDTVDTTSRLEALTQERKLATIVSEETARRTRSTLEPIETTIGTDRGALRLYTFPARPSAVQLDLFGS